MNYIAAFVFLFAFTYQSELLITRRFVEELRQEAPWEVESYENSIFKGWTVDEYKNAFCSDMDFVPENLVSDEEDQNLKLPEAFDGRKKWPKCIHPIRTQGRCGSCWAFATTESLSDRFCIAGRDVILAPQDMVSCDKGRGNKGCGGGYGPWALQYAEASGVLSEECFPYVSGKDGSEPPCPKGKCPGKGAFTKYFCQKGTVSIIKIKNNMKIEIMTKGPIATRMNNYEDFAQYRGGIYRHVKGKYLCGHYMKPVGWGVQGSEHYWIIANSFGPAWGEAGYVRFLMGDSMVDDFMCTCVPKV